MAVSTTIEVVGVKNAINSLRKIDPQLQKDFKADATAIAQPAINAGKAVYVKVPLSGMKYKWTQNDRKLFPFTTAKAVNGVRMRFDTRRNAVGVILIEQKDPAAAIAYLSANNSCVSALGTVFGISIKLVTPPATAARASLAIVALWVKPGSLKCT